jgi:phenylpyruvate tautomerase PptA (4-oxalocrotonate tautomerase family)
MPERFIEAPQGIRPEAKKKMMERITSAVDDAYHKSKTLIFVREYPAEDVAMDGRLQSENTKILEAFKKISAGALGRQIVKSPGKPVHIHGCRLLKALRAAARSASCK